jgi:uncharacterized membrane protein
MATIEKSIDVRVPVSVAYDQWTQFEEFPKFMNGIVEVRQLDDTHLHWVAEIGGERREWDAEIVEQKPDRVIAWRSTNGVPNSGRVEFLPIEDGTKVTVEMEYETEGAKEKIGSALGFDEGQVEEDLERFREVVEERQVPTGAWRGSVESGDVVDSSR